MSTPSTMRVFIPLTIRKRNGRPKIVPPADLVPDTGGARRVGEGHGGCGRATVGGAGFGCVWKKWGYSIEFKAFFRGFTH